MSNRIARVFPRKTNMTPDDGLAFINCPPPMLALSEIDAVHISVAFTWDLKRAEQLEKDWRIVGVPVTVGGPAFNEPGGEFVPGMYLKDGYVITSRGCPNRCWFCSVPLREGALRELPVADGWNILDDNLLACSEAHIREVFSMLGRQKRRAAFTGGMEAKLLKSWHVELLRSLKPALKRMYFAYDRADALDPLIQAGKLLRDGGFSAQSHVAQAYVLVGYKGDTFEKAEKRLRDAVRAGFVPYAMLYRDDVGETDRAWREFQRDWLRPEIVMAQIAKQGGVAG